MHFRFFTSDFRIVGAPSPHLHICPEADVGPFLPQCFQPGPGAKDAPLRGFRQTGLDPRAEQAKLREVLQVVDARAEPTAGIALSTESEDPNYPAMAVMAWDMARWRVGHDHYAPFSEPPGGAEPPAAAREHDGGNAGSQAEEEDWGQDDRGRKADTEPELPAPGTSRPVRGTSRPSNE